MRGKSVKGQDQTTHCVQKEWLAFILECGIIEKRYGKKQGGMAHGDVFESGEWII